MRRYEVMYIVRPNLEEEARNQLIANLNKVLTDKGTELTKVDEWGLKDLAYEIADFKKGYYVVLDINAPIEAVSELDRVMKINENVIRHIVISREEK